MSHPSCVVPEYHRATAGAVHGLHAVPAAVVSVALVSHHEGAEKIRESRMYVPPVESVVQLWESFLGALELWVFARRGL